MSRSVDNSGYQMGGDHIILMAKYGREELSSSLRITQYARAIGKEDTMLPLQELPILVGAVNRFNSSKGHSIKLSICEVDDPKTGLSYYLSTAKTVPAGQIEVNKDNIGEIQKSIRQLEGTRPTIPEIITHRPTELRPDN